MGIGRILGFILVVAGTVLLVLGYQSTRSLKERLQFELTGSYSERTTQQLAGGAGGVALGALLLAFGGGRGRRR